MTDKERILTAIIKSVIPGLMYSFGPERDEYVESFAFKPHELQHDDLVFAMTSFTPHDFTVGFVDHVESDHVVIRELGSKRLCAYYNESFLKINKKKLGYDSLEGVQYRTYLKAIKAFAKHTSYGTKFKSICFGESMCTLEGRKMFENDAIFSVTFPFNSKTTIKEIGQRLEEAEKENTEK